MIHFETDGQVALITIDRPDCERVSTSRTASWRRAGAAPDCPQMVAGPGT